MTTTGGGIGDVMHLKQTEAFISMNPVDIVLVRTGTVSDGKGGTLPDAAHRLASQRMRKVGSNFKQDLATRTTADGRQVKPSYVMIGMPEVDVEYGDHFHIEAQEFEVVFVSRSPLWRVSAEVIEVKDAG